MKHVWKPKKKRGKSATITKLTMSSGRVVTDPAEIQHLLKADGFTIDDATGKLGLGPKLIKQ